MAFKLTKNQCALLVGALTLFIVYLWGCRCMEKKPAVGGSLVSSGSEQVVSILPSDNYNQLPRGTPTWGWYLRNPDADVGRGHANLMIARYIDPTYDPLSMQILKPGQGSIRELILSLSGTGVSGRVGGLSTGPFYRSPGGEVHTEGGKGVGDKPLQLTLQRASDASNDFYLKDPRDGLILGYTDQYLRQDGPAPLVLGSLSDSNFTPLTGWKTY